MSTKTRRFKPSSWDDKPADRDWFPHNGFSSKNGEPYYLDKPDERVLFARDSRGVPVCSTRDVVGTYCGERTGNRRVDNSREVEETFEEIEAARAAGGDE